MTFSSRSEQGYRQTIKNNFPIEQWEKFGIMAKTASGAGATDGRFCSGHELHSPEEIKARGSAESLNTRESYSERSSAEEDQVLMRTSSFLRVSKALRSRPKRPQLQFQMGTLRKVIRKNLSRRGMTISFIHGIGNGILKAAIRKELNEVLALRCSYSVGDPAVTIVTIR